MSLAKTKSAFDSIEDDDSSHVPLMFPAHRNLALRKHRSVPKSTHHTEHRSGQCLIRMRAQLLDSCALDPIVSDKTV